MPQLKANAVNKTKRLSQIRRSSGKTFFTSNSRPRCMSRKVEEMKTRIWRWVRCSVFISCGFMVFLCLSHAGTLFNVSHTPFRSSRPGCAFTMSLHCTKDHRAKEIVDELWRNALGPEKAEGSSTRHCHTKDYLRPE